MSDGRALWFCAPLGAPVAAMSGGVFERLVDDFVFGMLAFTYLGNGLRLKLASQVSPLIKLREPTTKVPSGLRPYAWQKMRREDRLVARRQRVPDYVRCSKAGFSWVSRLKPMHDEIDRHFCVQTRSVEGRNGEV
jgi:hypothetical protein